MNRFLCISVAVIVIALRIASGQGQQQRATGGSAFHKNDITYSTDVVTPHIDWATKLPKGPIKSFFIPSVQYGRDMVELMQRLQLEPTTVSIDSSWDISCWGIGDYYGHEYRGDRDDFQIVYGYVEKDLTSDSAFEVMLIPGLNGWSRLTRATRDAILRRVQQGAGLVLLHPFVGDVKGHPFKGDEAVGDERIWDISPLIGVADNTVNERGYPEINQNAVTKGKWELAQRHFINEGLPLELLPEGNAGGSFYKYRATGEVLIKSGSNPIVAAKNYGKGRVVALAYVEEGFTPQSVNPTETKIYWDYWEYQYSLLARSIIWAAGRETEVRIKSLTANDAGVKLSLSSKVPQVVNIALSGKNEFGPTFGSTQLSQTLTTGDNSIEIPASKLRPETGWPGGRQIFNVIIRDSQSGATLNWGAATFETPKRAMMTTARPAVDVYKRGETLSVVLRATGDLSGLKVRMHVSDDLGRLLATISKPARGERTLTYTLADFLGKFAIVTGELVDERGAIVDQIRAKPVMVVQDIRRQKEYTALVSFGGTKHYLQDAQMRMVRGAAADTGFTWGGDVDNSLNIPRGTFGVYWYDRGPTTPADMERAIAEYQHSGDFEALGYLTKKELFKRTGDKKFLRRTPSFNDPGFMTTLSDIVRASARNKARYNMDYYFVGDEGSLTSYGDPVDFDWSPQTLIDFRLWLKQEYGALHTLNKEWRTNFRNWDDAVPYTTDEARKSRSFAPWADHRTFMEITFAYAYQSARDAVIQGDRDAHIAVSGTQATNAYNGADWSRLDSVIDDFLSYDGGNQWDMHRSFAKPGAMIGFWTGYGSRGVAVQNAIWTAAIHNVLHPNVFWMYSFLDPDLTYSDSARDMGAAFKSLRLEGVGKLLMESVRQQDGIALHYSMPSIHAASILGYHQRSSDDDDEVPDKSLLSFPANRDGWVRTIKDLGLQFDFVSSEQMNGNRLATGKYKVLILPLSLALSAEEVKNIEAFVAAGGVVVADAAAGLTDEHCGWQASNSLNGLFGITAGPADKREIKIAAGDVTVTEDGARWGLAANELGGLLVAEPDIRAAGSTTLLHVGKADALMVRRLGKGWTIYLNTVFDRYPKQRAATFGGASYRFLVNAILAQAGVKPSIEVLSPDGRRISQVQIARDQFGDAQILTIVKDNVAVSGVVGQDGVTVYNDANLGRVARQEIVIKLPRKLYVADVRSGKQLSYTDTIHTSTLVGDAVVLGLSTLQNKIALDGPDTALLGEHVSFSIASSVSGRRLLRCHVFAPDGSPLPVYARNVLMNDGSSTFILPSALNDASGRYTVRATDVVTGATVETRINLR
ncbi:MAG TPA: beta-galactosidase trimerization domain-containing protein [Pyrinomonadaceae bacterium]|nr:beta-galactosidase trimerization domain-containing protein [Pyrinomonadaceae bacterium]